jgi:hypothetical protein
MEKINMRRYDSRLLWGLLLIVGGGLFLLQNLGLLPFGEYIWAAVFALAGAVFLGVFVRDRQQWWAVIPGLTLLGVGLTAALAIFAPEQMGAWVGSIFLGMIALAFWIVYFTNRANWWAIIPGGTLLTLALISAASTIWGGLELGGLLFVGMGLTFALVAVLPQQTENTKWAYIPASVLLVMGLLIMAAATSLIKFVAPLALVAVGAFLLWRTFMGRRS